MTFVLGIPFTLASIAALVSITAAAGHAIQTSYDLTEQGVEHIRSSASGRLIRRCTTIAEMLHTMSNEFIVSSSGRAIVQTLVDCIEWSRKYDKKMKIKRLIFSETYKNRFSICNDTLTYYLQDMAHLANISTFIHCTNEVNNTQLNQILIDEYD